MENRGPIKTLIRTEKATIREYHVWKNGLKNDLKVIEDDIVDAKKQILEVKKYATKISSKTWPLFFQVILYLHCCNSRWHWWYLGSTQIQNKWHTWWTTRLDYRTWKTQKTHPDLYGFNCARRLKKSLIVILLNLNHLFSCKYTIFAF